jgi:tetratricopeptide (TPR) repeat protein
VVEALARVTPERRVGDALTALGEASEAFAEGSYQRAVRKAELAKDLAPRDTTVREVLGLAAYRLGDWQKALAELRAFRRMAGETTHLPVEIDVLRALGRDRDVEAAWQTLQDRGGKASVMKEGAVVYASHLVDQRDLDGAKRVAGAARVTRNPFPEDLRLWYVAARIAALQGDTDGAVRMRNAILENDPAFPGIDELETLIGRS